VALAKFTIQHQLQCMRIRTGCSMLTNIVQRKSKPLPTESESSRLRCC